MNNKIKDLVAGVCALVEVGCLIGLAGLALKRNNDCYKAECKLADTQRELFNEQIKGIVKDAKIEQLETRVNELKGEIKEEES